MWFGRAVGTRYEAGSNLNSLENEERWDGRGLPNLENIYSCPPTLHKTGATLGLGPTAAWKRLLCPRRSHLLDGDSLGPPPLRNGRSLRCQHMFQNPRSTPPTLLSHLLWILRPLSKTHGVNKDAYLSWHWGSLEPSSPVWFSEPPPLFFLLPRRDL